MRRCSPYSELARLQPGSRQESLRLLGEAVVIRERFLGGDDARTREARTALAAAR
jgi:hypothetical protein